MRAKLGLNAAQALDGAQSAPAAPDGGQPGDVARDRQLIENILKLLAKDRVDFTIFWRRLSNHMADDALAPVRDLFLDRAAFEAWAGFPPDWAAGIEISCSS